MHGPTRVRLAFRSTLSENWRGRKDPQPKMIEVPEITCFLQSHPAKEPHQDATGGCHGRRPRPCAAFKTLRPCPCGGVRAAGAAQGQGGALGNAPSDVSARRTATGVFCARSSLGFPSTARSTRSITAHSSRTMIAMPATSGTPTPKSTAGCCSTFRRGPVRNPLRAGCSPGATSSMARGISCR